MRTAKRSLPPLWAISFPLCSASKRCQNLNSSRHLWSRLIFPSKTQTNSHSMTTPRSRRVFSPTLEDRTQRLRKRRNLS
jgi:hypothetical protein